MLVWRKSLLWYITPRIVQAAVAVTQVQLAIGDLVLIWRVWVIWNYRMRIVILPVLALIAGLGVELAYATEAGSYSNLSSTSGYPRLIIVFSSQISRPPRQWTLRVRCGAIPRRHTHDHRVWRCAPLRSCQSDFLLPTNRIEHIIELSVIDVTMQLVNLILQRLKHPGLHVMLDIILTMANIVPTAIIILSHIKLTPRDDTMNETVVTVHFGDTRRRLRLRARYTLDART
ncbi:hypothetical protein C8Q74DRAFT_997101 [Fomes fomentarius]|nr:hypothetical protein C8Q74DRAFT_997101 [Fomes fomentarius]